MLLSIPYTADMNELLTKVGVTYVSYRLFSILAFLSVEFAIAVFIKHLAKDEVAIADHTVTI